MADVELYRTSDIYFAAYLMSVQVRLITTEDKEGRDSRPMTMFVFDLGKAQLRQLKALFFGGGGSVKAKHLCDNLRSLKSMCHV